MEITKKYVSALNEIEKKQMFEMYSLSYNLGGQQLWFSNPEELFKIYPCFVTFGNQYLVVYAMYQFKTKFNKISLVCHNGSEEGKELSIKLRMALVNTPGWILEAADKVSWLLRKKGANIIESYDSIVDALDIVDNPNDTIEMNPNFDKEDKLSYQYIRIYNDTINNKIYNSKETLFGTLPCKYEDQSKTNCERICNLLGGKKITNKKSIRKNKKSIRKNKKSIRKNKRKYKSKKIYRK